ncbi:MAG: ATP-binding cassette domain-containing protein [Candidatus Carbobacillus altaicus]|nr:ATP-binding cassette domain-containing protein [Candidatus Carbobacillus altaicus]
MTETPLLMAEQIKKTFNPLTPNEKMALNDVTLSLKKGEFCVVIGSNGAGKSTLLNAIAGRFPLDQGRVIIDGRDVTRLREFERARWIGRVFQDPLAGTAPSLTIFENMAIAYKRGAPRTLKSTLKRTYRERFIEALRELGLGLEGRLGTKVGTLSGGERQALTLVMATFTDPKLLLLDEHTAALDPKRAELINELTNKIVRQKKLTTLMITHNMEQALRLGDRLIMMHAGEIVLDLSAEEKSQMTVKGLIEAFEKVRGETFADDRVILG